MLTRELTMISRRVLMMALLAAALAFTACSSLPETPKPVSGNFACGQLDITVSDDRKSDLIAVDYLNQRILLKPEESASGALFVAPGQGILGNSAMTACRERSIRCRHGYCRSLTDHDRVS